MTCEATTHHFTLTHAECASYDPVFKVNPPLRTDDDVAAVRAGLADGTIDCIATDHAPHTQEAKEAAFDQAPPGMLGLETALAPRPHRARPARSPRCSRCCPGGRPRSSASTTSTACRWPAGNPANLSVIDPTATWVVDPAALASRSRNTPYAGRTLTGRVRHTLLHGEPVVIDGEAQR